MSSTNYTGSGAVLRMRLWQMLAAVVAAALLIPGGPARAGQKDDLYLEAFQLIQQGDTLLKADEKQAALRKYKKAQAELQSFRLTYPDYGVKMVAFRLNYVAEKIAACEAQPAAESAKQAQPGAKPSVSPSAVGAVKLLDAGAEPKTALRLHAKAGDHQNLNLVLKMAMEVQVGGMQNQAVKLPAITVPTEATVKAVSAEGDITYDTVMGEPSVADEGGSAAALAGVLKSSLASLKGLKGTGTITSRGILKSSNMKMVAGGDPNMRQALDQVQDSLSQMATPFPEEPVGPGAKWELTRPIKSQGMTLNQTATYELVSVDGDHITVKDSFVQNAANQKIQNPAMPSMKLDLVKMSARGSGERQLDLAQLLPLHATVDSHSEVTMGMNMGGQKRTMNMKLDLNLQLETK